ncbi:MAG: 50S ribosomal protein L10, partial [Clostridia bacterium]|nr:50S ribosomal protein L10 [Clostridia bacterium]
FIDGEPISLEKIDSLAKLPNKETLLATVVYAFQAPMAAFARAIQAVADKAGAPAEEAAPAAEEAPAETAAPAEEAPAAE